MPVTEWTIPGAPAINKQFLVVLRDDNKKGWSICFVLFLFLLSAEGDNFKHRVAEAATFRINNYGEL